MAEQTMATLPPPVRITADADETLFLEVDAAISEAHTSTDTITKHPVEQGFNVSDHIRPEPDGLQMECVISETPLSREQMQRAIEAGATSSGNPAPHYIPGYVQHAYNAAQALRGHLLNVRTGLRTYGIGNSDKMAIVSISSPRSVATVFCWRFSITFETIRVVSNKLTQANPTKSTRTAKQQDAGTATPQLDEGDFNPPADSIASGF